MRVGLPSNIFGEAIAADAQVPGTVEEVYALLRDADFVGRSAPFIRRITPLADDVWWWEVGGIRHPGGTFAAGFTQRMTFDPPHEIAFRHDPGALEGTAQRQGRREAELAGAEGVFRLTPLDPDGAGDGVRVELEMRIQATVPAPASGAPVVEAAMRAVLTRMRDRFTAALVQAQEAR